MISPLVGECELSVCSIETFTKMQPELRSRIDNLWLQLDALDRSHAETAELAAKVFELSQALRQHWLTADCAGKRRIREVTVLNRQLDKATPGPQ